MSNERVIIDSEPELTEAVIAQAQQAPPMFPKLQAKAPIPTEHKEGKEGKEPAHFTPEQMKAVSQLVSQMTAKKMQEAGFDASAPFQVVAKDKVSIIDFSKLTEEQLYDLDMGGIEARPFATADILKCVLKDSNYVARWVNKNPQRLGFQMAAGFTYVVNEDLHETLALEVTKDSQGHYAYDDVVLMKIDKATYYRALKHAQARAQRATDNVNAQNAAAEQANAFMSKTAGAEYREAKAQNKVEFYKPQFTV